MSDSDSPPLYDVDFDESDEFNFVDPWLYSPLIRAVRENDLNRLQELVASGKSVNINDNQGNTPLHHAIITNNEKIFEFLLNLDEIRLDVENFQGQTPLLLSAKLKLNEFSRELIKQGADVNLVELSGESVLHYFAADSVSVCKLLIDEGVDLNVGDSWGRTPLHVACETGNFGVVELLVEAGADCCVSDENSLLPFTISLSKLPGLHQNLLFLMTYDSDSSVNLRTLIEAMLAKSDFFPKLLQLKFAFTQAESDFFAENFLRIPPEMLRLFSQQYGDFYTSVLKTRNLFNEIFKQIKHNSFQIIYFSSILSLFESQQITQLVERLNLTNNLEDLLNSQLSEDLLSSILFGLLSFGLELRLYDLLLLLSLTGYSNLFKMLLHHNLRVDEDSRIFGVCRVILQRNGALGDLLILLGRFNACRELQRSLDGCSDVEEAPVSLFRLAVVASRDFLVGRFEIRSHVRYFTVVRSLGVAEWLKKVLSCEVA